MTAQVAADLRAAAEVLRRDGWTQGAFHRWIDNGPCHCAEGAIAVATGRHLDVRHDPFNSQGVDWTPIRDESTRHFAALEALEETVGMFTIPRWNDDTDRTVAEVIAALKAAADAAEIKAAYDEGRWCGECQYGVVNDPPCCTQGPVNP